MTNKVEELNERYEKLKDTIVRSEAVRDQLKQKEEELILELKQLGINPETAEEEVEQIQKEVAELTESLEEKLNQIEQKARELKG